MRCALSRHEVDLRPEAEDPISRRGPVRDDGPVRLRSALRAVAAGHGVAFRVTPNQNLYLVDVPAAARGPIASLLEAHGSRWARPSAACAGSRWPAPCGLAVTEAERVVGDVVDDLQGAFDKAAVGDAVPTVRMTGCPNGCARPYVAEIGLVGDAVDRYQLWLGGDAAGTRLATAVAEGVHRNDLVTVIAPILARYRDERLSGEAFGDYVARAGITAVEYANAPRRAARIEEPA